MLSILNKRSSTHPNWCEDNYWVKETDKQIIGAVLDGCSTGKDSHFASTLFKHLLEMTHFEFEWNFWEGTPEETTDNYLFKLWLKLGTVKELCNLTDLHLLSTIVFFIYDKKTLQLTVKFIGDGVIYANGQETMHDENNMPNYLAYQLGQESFVAFGWIEDRPTYIFENVVDFSVCTDGIQSFTNLKDHKLDPKIAIDYLVRSDKWAHTTMGLSKKFNQLTNKNPETKLSEEMFWWDILDDLTIIRYHATV